MANYFELPEYAWGGQQDAKDSATGAVEKGQAFLNQKMQLTDLWQLSYVDGNETFVNNSKPINFAEKLASPGKYHKIQFLRKFMILMI